MAPAFFSACRDLECVLRQLGRTGGDRSGNSSPRGASSDAAADSPRFGDRQCAARAITGSGTAGQFTLPLSGHEQWCPSRVVRQSQPSGVAGGDDASDARGSVSAVHSRQTRRARPWPGASRVVSRIAASAPSHRISRWTPCGDSGARRAATAGRQWSISSGAFRCDRFPGSSPSHPFGRWRYVRGSMQHHSGSDRSLGPGGRVGSIDVAGHRRGFALADAAHGRRHDLPVLAIWLRGRLFREGVQDQRTGFVARAGVRKPRAQRLA